jgi:N-acyl-D-amino-acid deacylase
VTTEVVGNCGFSPAPVSDAFRQEMKGFALYLPAGMDFSWRTVGDYLARYEDDGVAVNVVQLIGHGTLRLAAMGFARRPPTAAEQGAMERLMDEAMADGAYGLATGLIYAPGSYAAVKRLADPSVVARVRRELMGGGETLLRGLEWSDIMVSYAPSRPDAQGRRIAEIAAAWKRDPLDAVIDLIVAEHGKGSMILFQLDEADLRRHLAHPHVMVGSDGSSLVADGPLATGKPHPRSYGTFPRVLGRYARDERVLSLPDAVWKMTGLPARRLGLADRGVLAPGAKADVVVFDAATVADRATYEDPHRYAAGIGHVLVNGRVVIADGEHTGALPGRVLRPA